MLRRPCFPFLTQGFGSCQNSSHAPPLHRARSQSCCFEFIETFYAFWSPIFWFQSVSDLVEFEDDADEDDTQPFVSFPSSGASMETMLEKTRNLNRSKSMGLGESQPQGI